MATIAAEPFDLGKKFTILQTVHGRQLQFWQESGDFFANLWVGELGQECVQFLQREGVRHGPFRYFSQRLSVRMGRQSRHRHGAKEDPGTTGLPGIDIVEDGAEGVLVDVHRARTGPAADGPARVEEFDRMLDVPRQAVIA